MRLRVTWRYAATVLAVLAGAAWAVAGGQSNDEKDGGKLAGSWSMVSVTPEGDSVNWKLNIKGPEGGYTATVASEDGEGPAKDFKVTGKKVHLVTTYKGADYDINVEVDGEKMTGKWEGTDSSGATTGKRTLMGNK